MTAKITNNQHIREGNEIKNENNWMFFMISSTLFCIFALEHRHDVLARTAVRLYGYKQMKRTLFIQNVS